jgi:hypothetical protein
VADLALIRGQLHPVLDEGEVRGARGFGQGSVRLFGAPVDVDVPARSARTRWARLLLSGGSLFHLSNPRGLSWLP